MLPSVLRRKFLQLTVAPLVGSGVGAASKKPASERASKSADSTEPAWSMARYDGGNTSYNPYANGPSGGVQKKWRFSMPEFSTEGVAPPVVANGRVFTASDEHVFALDAADGSVEHRYSPSAPYSSFAVVGNRLYVAEGARSLGWGGPLRAFDVKSGSQLWNRSVEGETYPDLLVDRGTVYLTAFLGEDTGTMRVAAIDGATGKQKWTADGAHGAAVTDGNVYTASNGVVTSLNAADGSVQWQVHAGAGRPLVVHDKTVYASGDRKLVALRTADGSTKWTKSFDAGPPEVATTGGTLFVTTTDTEAETGRLAALDPSSGNIRWQTALDHPVSTPTTDGNSVYVAMTKQNGNTGSLAGFDLATGKRTWTHGDGTWFDETPAQPRLADGTLYATSGNVLTALTADR